MGSPDFAAVILRRLLAPDSPVQVVAVATQPDKPAGRGNRLTAPPVKRVAHEHGLPVLQPLTLRRPSAVAALERSAPDLGIVAAYGKILPGNVLDVCRRGFLNVHASLLPRWRGAWPIGAAILAGDAVTGVSIMRLDEGMDTGPVLATRTEPIRAGDTTGSLEARLARLGAELLVETIPGYICGAVVPQPQDDRAATYCRLLRREDTVLDWSHPAVDLERRVRALLPQPVASTTWQGKQLRILAARALPEAPPAGTSPGMVLPLGKHATVATGQGQLVLEQVQVEGKKPVQITSFLNGYRGFVGSRLGEP